MDKWEIQNLDCGKHITENNKAIYDCNILSHELDGVQVTRDGS